MGLYKIIERKRRAEKRKATAKVIVTGMSGVTLGAIAGILFAPKSGKETRDDIKEKSEVIVEQVKNKTVDIKENLTDKAIQSKEDLIEAKKRISEYLNKKKASEEENSIEAEEEQEVTEELQEI